MTRPPAANVTPKLRRLAQMASDLRRGKSFAITRLLTLKGFCDDPEAAPQFAVFLARQAQRILEQKSRPDYIPEDRWVDYRRLVTEAIRAIDMYLEARTESGAHELHVLRRALELLQNQHRRSLTALLA